VLLANDRGITCWAVFEETASPTKTIVVSIELLLRDERPERYRNSSCGWPELELF
jgi:hypothetical protein